MENDLSHSYSTEIRDNSCDINLKPTPISSLAAEVKLRRYSFTNASVT